MAFRPIAPPPDLAAPVWEPDGLPENGPTIERHRDTGAIRVNPDALLSAFASWEASIDREDPDPDPEPQGEVIPF